MAERIRHETFGVHCLAVCLSLSWLNHHRRCECVMIQQTWWPARRSGPNGE